MCILCEREHNKIHNQFYYDNILKNSEDKQLLKQLNINIDKFKININEIIMVLNKVLKNIEIYYNISSNIINNDEFINYQILNFPANS